MKFLVFLVSYFLFLSTQGQKKQKYNFGFEDLKEGKELSEGWFEWGSYDLSIDSIAYSGERSGKITSTGKNGNTFGCIAYKIPKRYKGDSIKLEGYMKIKDVENGFAGLLLRVDGKDRPAAFDNMRNQNINGTRDWQKYSITLTYPELMAENVIVAGILTGKGEAWFDDFTVTIDGKKIEKMKATKRPVSKVSQDKEFNGGSKIEFPQITPQLTEDLERLGLIWGFLKYHHPKIAAANYNWDYELFRFLPTYLESTDKEKLLVEWIEKLGKIKTCKDCPSTPSDAFAKPDFKWMERFGVTLKDKLLLVYKNRNQKEHYYIEMVNQVGNPNFKNELSYSSMTYPDDGIRLLAVYRFWNMVNYFFPYKHLMDNNWELALRKFIPNVINAKSELEYEFVMLEMIGWLQDTHANLWGGGDKIKEWKGNFYPPFHTRFIEDKLVVDEYYNPELKEKAGLAIGDVINKINGKKVKEIVEDATLYYPASNQPTRLRDLGEDILRSNDSILTIEYTRNGIAQNSKLQLYKKDSLNVYRWYKKHEGKSYKMLDNNIGYITLQSIQAEDIPKIKEELKNTKGIIIDIRNYPSYFVPFALGSFFVKEATPFVKFTNGNVNNPGEFTFTQEISIQPSEEYYSNPLVVLINEHSQSQSEYTAMAFRAGDNTTIVGSTTAGADGNVSQIILPGGLSTIFSGIGVYYPDGEETQRVGIVPDIEVKPTIEGIKSGKDEVLEKAIEVILRK